MPEDRRERIASTIYAILFLCQGPRIKRRAFWNAVRCLPARSRDQYAVNLRLSSCNICHASFVARRKSPATSTVVQVVREGTEVVLPGDCELVAARRAVRRNTPPLAGGGHRVETINTVSHGVERVWCVGAAWVPAMKCKKLSSPLV